MKKNVFVLALSFIVSVSGFSQHYWLNKTYPKLSFNSLLQSPVPSAAEKYFDGKTVVLEFWATWCSPCLANVPHINEVQSHFANDTNVVFVSITDEPKLKIEPFLKKRKLNGWIACDPERKMHNAYGVSGIPKTFIIDAKGLVVYDGRPESLTVDLINKVLKGDYLPKLPEIKTSNVQLFGGWGGGEDPIFTANFSVEGYRLIPYQHTIRPTIMPQSGGSGWVNSGSGTIGITMINVSIEKALALLTEQVSFKRVVNYSSINEQQWDIIFSRTRNYTMEKAQAEIVSSLKETLSINFKDTVITQTVMKATVGNQLSAYKREKNIDWDDPTMKSYRKLTDLLSTLEERSDTLISLDDDFADIYIDTFGDMMKLYKMSGQELQKWLEDKGIVFSKTQQPVTMLWVY